MEKDFGLDPEKGFAYKLEVGKIAKAWNIAKVQSDVKMKADAAARAHGVPISLLEPDWASLMNAFKNKYGSHIPANALPAESFFESFEEMLANGTLKAGHFGTCRQREGARRPRRSKARAIETDGDASATSFGSILAGVCADGFVHLLLGPMSNVQFISVILTILYSVSIYMIKFAPAAMIRVGLVSPQAHHCTWTLPGLPQIAFELFFRRLE